MWITHEEKKVNFSDSPWHLSIGGQKDSDTLSSVELFNWKTGQKCFIDDLPQVLICCLTIE